MVEHDFKVGGVVRGGVVAVVFDQFGGFALKGDEGRIGFEQARGDADEVGFDGFGGNPNGQHFDGTQAGVNQLAAGVLQQGGIGAGADQVVQAQPLADAEGLQPFVVVFGVEKVEEHFAQVGKVFVGRAEAFVYAYAHLAGKAVAREDAEFDQRGIDVDLRKPVVEAATEVFSEFFVLFERGDNQVEAFCRLFFAAAPQEFD